MAKRSFRPLNRTNIIPIKQTFSETGRISRPGIKWNDTIEQFDKWSSTLDENNGIPLERLHRMAKHPAVKAPLFVSSMPITSADWNIKSVNGKYEDEANALEILFSRFWDGFISNLTKAKIYGFYVMEKVLYWQTVSVNGKTMRLLNYKFFPISPLRVHPEVKDGKLQKVVQDAGAYLKNLSIDAEKILWFTNSPDMAMGNIEGYSDVGDAYDFWRYLCLCQLMFMDGLQSAILPNIIGRAPLEDQGQDKYGRDLGTGIDVMNRIIEEYQGGDRISLPNDKITDMDGNIQGDYEWDMEFKYAQHNLVANYKNAMREWRALIALCLLVPAKAVEHSDIRGSFGETEVYTDLAVNLSQVKLNRIQDFINADDLNDKPLLRSLAYLNFGPSMEDAFRFKFERIDIAIKQIYRSILISLIQNGDESMAEYLKSTIDIGEIASKLGLPLLSKTRKKAIEETPGTADNLNEQNLTQEGKNGVDGKRGQVSRWINS